MACAVNGRVLCIRHRITNNGATQFGILNEPAAVDSLPVDLHDYCIWK